MLGLNAITDVADDALDTVAGAVSTIGDAAVHHVGDILTVVAIGTCIVSGALVVCAAGAALAFGGRVAQRHLFECGTLTQDLIDAGLTTATFGLVGAPASLAEAGQSLSQRVITRGLVASPDIAGFVGGQLETNV